MKKNPDAKNAPKAIELTDEDAEGVAGGLISFAGGTDLSKSVADAVKRARSVSGGNHGAPKDIRPGDKSLPGRGGGKTSDAAGAAEATARNGLTDKDRGGW